MSALPPKADMCSAQAHVRLVPIADSRSAAIGTLFIPRQRAQTGSAVHSSAWIYLVVIVFRSEIGALM